MGLLPRQNKLLRIGRVSGLAAGFFLFALVMVIIIYSNKPAVGTVNPSYLKGNDVAADTPKDTVQVPASGNFVSFTYPSTFEPTHADKPAGNQLEIFNFVKGPAPFWFMNTEVGRLPTGKLADDGSYNMRLVKSEQYKLKKWDIDGRSVDVFTDTTEPYAKTGFVAQGNKIFSVSITSNDIENKDKLDSAMQDVLKSLEWK